MNHRRALAYCFEHDLRANASRVVTTENRFTLFRIMLYPTGRYFTSVSCESIEVA